MMNIKDIGNCFLDVLMPRKCPVCENILNYQEPYLFTHCLFHIPITRFHKTTLNSVEQLFAVKVPIVRPTGFFYYLKRIGFSVIFHVVTYLNSPTFAGWLDGYLS